MPHDAPTPRRPGRLATRLAPRRPGPLATRLAPRRPGPARRAVLVLAAVVALGACTGSRQVPDSYGDTTRDNFIEGCQEALTQTDGGGEAVSARQATSVCEDTYACISDPDEGIPFEEFKKINDALEEEPGPLPEPIRQRIEACDPQGALS